MLMFWLRLASLLCLAELTDFTKSGFSSRDFYAASLEVGQDSDRERADTCMCNFTGARALEVDDERHLSVTC